MVTRSQLIALAGLALAIVGGFAALRQGRSREAPPGGWIGSTACGECHGSIVASWEASYHHQAMLPAAPDAGLLAPDDRAPLVRRGESLVFVDTGVEKLDGTAAAWVLGRKHIEQYLGGVTPGRLQALPLAFDIRAGDWFDLFAGETRTPDDWGHWTNRGMIAETQCIVCHTTGFEKGYRPETDSYESRWVEIGVGCEACHGPGHAHADARRRGVRDPWTGADPELVVAACAGCHSRRVERAAFVPGTAFLDAFEPELLDTDAYYPDGQVKEELYELVSLQQSRMWEEGTRCWSCHDPHANGVKRPGNGLCLGCHRTEYSAEPHVHHAADSPGATCVGCHMPVTVYMQRDPRHDHRFGRPDPELTRALGIPNACNKCHTDRDATWAAEHVARWYPDDGVRRRRRREAEAIAGGRIGDPTSIPGLLALASSGNAVRRASAIRLLARFPTASGVTTTLLAAMPDPDPLVRTAATWALGQRETVTAGVRTALVEALRDPVRAVRTNAALALREVPRTSLAPGDATAFEDATREWRASQDLGADTPEAHYNLAIFHSARGELQRAAAEYEHALRLWPRSIQAAHNLGMLQAQRGDLGAAERAFRRVLDVDPVPQTLFALGLLHGQQGRWEEAIAALERCVATDPAYPRARYNLALAYAKSGDTARALDALEMAAEQPDTRREAVLTLVDLARHVNDRARLEKWVLEAAKLDPSVAENPQLRELVGE